MINIEPHVKNIVGCVPIMKSEITKEKNTTGRNFTPKIIGAKKLNAIVFVKFGGCGTNLLTASNIKIKANFLIAEL